MISTFFWIKGARGLEFYVDTIRWYNWDIFSDIWGSGLRFKSLFIKVKSLHKFNKYIYSVITFLNSIYYKHFIKNFTKTYFEQTLNL